VARADSMELNHCVSQNDLQCGPMGGKSILSKPVHSVKCQKVPDPFTEVITLVFAASSCVTRVA
jgi:hypothetical protein